jgi:cytochrome P450
MDVRRSDWRDRPALASVERSMLNTDGPRHTRKLASQAFTPRSVEAWRPRVEAIVTVRRDEEVVSSGRTPVEQPVARYTPSP